MPLCTQVLLDVQDPQVCVVSPVFKGSPAIMELPEPLDLLEQQDEVDLRVFKDSPDLVVTLDNLDAQVTLTIQIKYYINHEFLYSLFRSYTQ